MDLKQRKLSKSEWESIEIPVSKDENEVLQLITNGFSNVHLKINKTETRIIRLIVLLYYGGILDEINKYFHFTTK